MNMQKRVSSKQKREQSLWSFLRKQILGKDEAGNQENASKHNKNRIIILSSVVAGFIILFFLVEPSSAQSPSITQTIANWAIGILAKVVVWLAEMLGYILIFLIELLISIVQYNNFVDAVPVQIGWPLIRDTVNMFFIVVVLVSAFATIIGYPKDFNYRQVLPKLLIMAVLINFSKTLIGLMIDFSQVIVLTFVNGFKQAAGGNFVSALGIGKVMRLSDTTGVITDDGDEITISLANAGSARPWSLMGILVSAIFAVWIISISITLILIMLIFFLARIIMLWFLLITSPIAFFAWSLPSQLKSALGPFTNEWWSRLSAALVGGPTMAFFLWLSLAMAQRQTDLVGSAGLYDPAKVSSEVTQFQQTAQDIKVNPTEFGDPEVFATFIIMVAFMLLGVQTSVGFAQKVAPGTERLIGQLSSSKAGIGVAGGLAAGAIAGRYAAKGAKVAGKGAWAAGREVEARTGILAKAAGEARKNKYFSLLPMPIQKKAGALAGSQQKAAKEKAAAMQEVMAGMSAAERFEYLKNQKAILEASPVPARKGDLMGVNLALAQQATNSLTMSSLQDAKKEDAFKQLQKEGAYDSSVTFDQVKDDDKVKTRAYMLAHQAVSEQLSSAKETAQKMHDEDTMKKINAMLEKDPSLAPKAEKMIEQAKNAAGDKEEERKVKPEAYSNAVYALHFAKSKGWIDDEGRLTAKAGRDDQFTDFMRGKQGDYLKSHLEYSQTEQGKKQAKMILTGKDASGKDIDVDKQNYVINVSKDGKQYTVVQRPGVVSPNSEFKHKTSRFDRKADTAEEVLAKVEDVNVRNQITNNIGSVGTGAQDAGAIGTVLPPMVAQQMGNDLERLDELEPGRSGAIDPEYEELRAEMGEKYLRHDVSTKFLFGHDAATGDFSDARGRKAFEDTISNLVSKITDDEDYSQETLASLASLSKQVGNQGEAFRIMQQKLSNLNQEQIHNAMRLGDKKDAENIQIMFSDIVEEANKQRNAGQTGTEAIKFRNAALTPPDVRGLSSNEKKAKYEIHRRTRNLLFEGKE